MTMRKAHYEPTDGAKASCGKPISIDGIFPSSAIKVTALAEDEVAGSPTEQQTTKAAPKPAPAAAFRQVVEPPKQKLSKNPWQPEAQSNRLVPVLGLVGLGLLTCAGLLFFPIKGVPSTDAAQTAQVAPVETQTPQIAVVASQPQASAPAELPVSDIVQTQAQVVPLGAASANTTSADPVEASFSDRLMETMTANTLAALRGSGSTEAASAPTQPLEPVQTTALFELLTTAVAQGQSEDYIDQLVNGAHARQEITVPSSLIGANGRVDTATLLAVFIGN